MEATTRKKRTIGDIRESKKSGEKMVYTSVPEAEMYEPMLALAREFPEVDVGSYPQSERRQLVIRLRGHDQDRLEAAAARLRELCPGT